MLVTTVYRWTGREAKLLRQALRLSVRDFAARLGVGVRTVNKWEARQADITPLPHMQQVLDTALAQASDEAKARFADGALLKRHDELAVTKHEYAASQSESHQADRLAPPSTCAAGKPRPSQSLDRTRLVRSTTLGATWCSLRRGTIEVPSRRQSR